MVEEYVSKDTFKANNKSLSINGLKHRETYGTQSGSNSFRVGTVAMVSSKTQAPPTSILLNIVGFCSPLADRFMDARWLVEL